MYKDHFDQASVNIFLLFLHLTIEVYKKEEKGINWSLVEVALSLRLIKYSIDWDLKSVSVYC